MADGMVLRTRLEISLLCAEETHLCGSFPSLVCFVSVGVLRSNLLAYFACVVHPLQPSKPRTSAPAELPSFLPREAINAQTTQLNCPVLWLSRPIFRLGQRDSCALKSKEVVRRVNENAIYATRPLFSRGALSKRAACPWRASLVKPCFRWSAR